MELKNIYQIPIGLVFVFFVLIINYDRCVDKVVFFEQNEKYQYTSPDGELYNLYLLKDEGIVLSKDSGSYICGLASGTGYHKFGPLFKKDNSFLFGYTFHKNTRDIYDLKVAVLQYLEEELLFKQKPTELLMTIQISNNHLLLRSGEGEVRYSKVPIDGKIDEFFIKKCELLLNDQY